MGQVQQVRMKDMMPLMKEKLAAGQSVQLSPVGISMLPMLRQGKDCVILKPVSGRLKKYDIPLYQRDDGHYVLHRIIKVGETYTCMGDNQFREETGVRQDQLIAVVSGFTRDGNYRSVETLSYRVYCRFWHYTRPVRRLYRAVKRRLHRIFGR
ncbi:MAG: hypothetical protein E7433_06005 [Ruminococcaceae bacterium]|nr:hypothetical protein [Oscillospiraceae bacterium]